MSNSKQLEVSIKNPLVNLLKPKDRVRESRYLTGFGDWLRWILFNLEDCKSLRFRVLRVLEPDKNHKTVDGSKEGKFSCSSLNL